MNDYLEFLRTYGYLEPASTTEQRQIMLTIKGEHLLASLGGLVELEDQITCFRNGSSRKAPFGTSALAIQKRALCGIDRKLPKVETVPQVHEIP